jgi:hypothetical protein
MTKFKPYEGLVAWKHCGCPAMATARVAFSASLRYRLMFAINEKDHVAIRAREQAQQLRAEGALPMMEIEGANGQMISKPRPWGWYLPIAAWTAEQTDVILFAHKLRDLRGPGFLDVSAFEARSILAHLHREAMWAGPRDIRWDSFRLWHRWFAYALRRERAEPKNERTYSPDCGCATCLERMSETDYGVLMMKKEQEELAAAQRKIKAKTERLIAARKNSRRKSAG